jgi:hypothetical protein
MCVSFENKVVFPSEAEAEKAMLFDKKNIGTRCSNPHGLHRMLCCSVVVTKPSA